MGRRLADTNPALIEPEVAFKAKKPRLSQIESTAMLALLSFRTATLTDSGTPAQSSLSPPPPPALAVKVKKDMANNASSVLSDTDASHITDDEESSSICSHQSQSSFASPGQQVFNQGPPPPLRKSMVKPLLPNAKLVPPLTSNNSKTRKCNDLPQGRPLGFAPGLAKHLSQRTHPICLKLSP